MSAIVVSGGATLFITNSDKPNGGDVVLISMFRRKMTANHSGSKPSSATTGMNIGTVIIMMGTTPMNMPNTTSTIMIATMINIGDSGRAVTKATSPAVAPVKDMIWLKTLAAAMIISIMVVILNAFLNDVRIISHDSEP